MSKKVKFRCTLLSENFIAACETMSCPDLENPNLFKVTKVYNESCAFFQLGQCPSKDCVFALGEKFDYVEHLDPNSLDYK